MGKVIKLDNLIPKLKKLDKEKTVGLITGCFDILHKGHKDLLSFAKSKCDILIVGLDSDAAIKKTKGSDRPINNQTTRANNLVKTELPDYVLLLEGEEKFVTSFMIPLTPKQYRYNMLLL